MEDRTTAAVKEILGRLGIEAVESYDAVSSAVDAELERRGFTARVSGIRWGCVTIVADRREISQVNWMKDVLEHIARRSSNGAITSVRIRGSENIRTRAAHTTTNTATSTATSTAADDTRDDERKQP